MARSAYEYRQKQKNDKFINNVYYPLIISKPVFRLSMNTKRYKIKMSRMPECWLKKKRRKY